MSEEVERALQELERLCDELERAVNDLLLSDEFVEAFSTSMQ